MTPKLAALVAEKALGFVRDNGGFRRGNDSAEFIYSPLHLSFVCRIEMIRSAILRDSGYCREDIFHSKDGLTVYGVGHTAGGSPDGYRDRQTAFAIAALRAKGVPEAEIQEAIHG
jgi:hypothetical protein